MKMQRFLTGCLAVGAALTLPSAVGQAPTAMPRPTPTPVAPAPLALPPSPALAPPVLAPTPMPAPAPAAAYEPSRGAESREYSFEDDTVSGELARPDGAFSAGAAAGPPDVPAYSDLCKAAPKPPWCSDAPKGGNGN
jgi:hypothetical protein